VQYYAVLIAAEMALPDRVIKRLRIGAMLHDIGMLALPDSILLCENRLTEEQLQAMRRHPLLSVRIMEGMEFLEQEIPTVRYHHERFDGNGYPEGLAGAAIPLTARVLSVADAFDAMTSPRTFRAAKSISESLEELRQGSRTQFDPAVIEAIVSVAGRMGQDLLNVPNVSRSAAGGAQDHDLPDAAAQPAPAEANV
jgi:HD-GYP domain-containing protein (c-di-GMP phosphodiesterase class II)